VSGFTDLAPVVREQTLKSVLTLVTKLSDRTVNGELLKYLARTANDEQPGIRTNTTICLGKIAKYLGGSSRAKVLIAAFTRSLRDPFVHARNASLLALAATSEYFNEEDSAARILPAVCPLLIDQEKMIRDQANKTADVFMQKVRKAAASMPDTALPPTSAVEGSAGPRMSTPQPSETTASIWAGWAISSFTNKLSSAAGEIQSNGNGAASPKPNPSPAAEPGQTGAGAGAGPAVSSTIHRQVENIKSPPLMSRSSSAGATAAALFQDNDNGDDGADAWGDMGDDSFFDAPEAEAESWPQSGQKDTAHAASISYDDGGEPDFAGWLAAQSQKKSVGNKSLPRGLAKSKPSATAAIKKTSTTSKAAVKPVVAKKIDLKPKDTGDDDGWGDGW